MNCSEILKKLISFINIHLGFSISFALCCLLLLCIAGCDSTVDSLTIGGKRVNRLGLDAEVNYFLDKAEVLYSDLDKQDTLKNLIANHALIYTQTGSFNPIALASTLFGLLGAGAVTDNVRLRRKVRETVKTA